jgi:hypothetical protein
MLLLRGAQRGVANGTIRVDDLEHGSAKLHFKHYNSSGHSVPMI